MMTSELCNVFTMQLWLLQQPTMKYAERMRLSRWFAVAARGHLRACSAAAAADARGGRAGRGDEVCTTELEMQRMAGSTIESA